MTQKPQANLGGMPFSGYYRDIPKAPDMFLCGVRRGTPGGEYLRRFWHPIAYESELGNVPLRVRALGEDLVVFRNGRGEIGALDRKSTRLNSSHIPLSRMPASA